MYPQMVQQIRRHSKIELIIDKTMIIIIISRVLSVHVTIHVRPEAAHFSLKMGKWVVSGFVVLCCLHFLNYLSNLFLLVFMLLYILYTHAFDLFNRSR